VTKGESEGEVLIEVPHACLGKEEKERIKEVAGERLGWKKIRAFGREVVVTPEGAFIRRMPTEFYGGSSPLKEAPQLLERIFREVFGLPERYQLRIVLSFREIEETH